MSQVGTEIGILQATDPDKGQIITYIMLQDAQGRFFIDGNKLKVLTVTCILDFDYFSHLISIICLLNI